MPQPADVQEFARRHLRKDLLRFLTCGSVDDGKSTLIGRVLFDAGLVPDDQLAAARTASQKAGRGELDLSLLVDGLAAEREQGITIDVAWRYFTTARRKFIVADTPGHVQYTRNMVTGASHCSLAVILVDASLGLSTQTRRHAFLTSLLGIRHLVFAINKMDAVGWSEETFETIRAEAADMVSRLQVTDVHFVPVSALTGDNVVKRSASMPWYGGGPLLDLLETIHISSDRNLIDLRMYVQYVARLSERERGLCGTIASGIFRRGAEVVVTSSGVRSKIAAMWSRGEPVDEAFPPMSVMIQLEDQVDVSRGDCVAHPANLPVQTRELEANLVWMVEEPLSAGASLLMKQGSKQVPVVVTKVRQRINTETTRAEQTDTLQLNEIGRCHLSAVEEIAFDAYTANRTTGAFVLIHRLTNQTVAGGMVVSRIVADVETAGEDVARRDREARNHHRALAIWCPDATEASALERRLFARGISTYALVPLDGEDRKDTIQRTAAMVRHFVAAGLVVVIADRRALGADRELVTRYVDESDLIEGSLDAADDLLALLTKK